MAGLDRANGLAGAADGVLRQFRGMGIARRLARQRAQPESLVLVEGGAFDAAIV
jgi:hypothetical protein